MGINRTCALAANPAFEVVAAADTVERNIDKLQSSLKRKVERFGSQDGYRNMINRCDLDAVGIFSPHSLHYEQAKYALENDLHVLIEKPMICGAGQAIEVAKLAEERKRIFLITYQRHYLPHYLAARRMIRQGRIGEVKGFYVLIAQDWWWPHTWRGDPKFSAGGQINDSGSHFQDILLWMTGLLPKSVEGHIDYSYRDRKADVEMNGMFHVELSNGSAGHLSIFADYVGGFTEDVRIVGEKGYIFFDKEVLCLGRNLKSGKRQIKTIPCKLPNGYPTDPVDNFAKLLTGKTRKNHVPAIFGAQVALLNETLLEAGKVGRRIYCEDVLRRSARSFDDLVSEEAD
jgi:predicted dehydrogenase